MGEAIGKIRSVIWNIGAVPQLGKIFTFHQHFMEKQDLRVQKLLNKKRLLTMKIRSVVSVHKNIYSKTAFIWA